MMAAKVRRPPEVKEQALAMYEDGMLTTHIAAELGIPYTTVAAWCDPATAAKQKARRTRYAGVCVDCGATTDGSNGFGSAAKRCATCQARYQHETRKWTPETIVAAIRAFAEANGRPPAAGDFTPALNVAHWSPERYRRALAAKASGDYPSVGIVTREFGGWQKALTAAGFGTNQRGRPAHMTTHTRNSSDRVAAMFDRELTRIQARAAALEEDLAHLREDEQRLLAARELLTASSNGNSAE